MAAILAGCKWSFAGERAELYLRANGRDQLTPHLPAAERLLTERFGVRMGIDVISNHEPVGEELFAETEKMRLAALRDVPVPSAPAGKPQGGKDAKPAAPSQTIYGKPFHGNVTPMRELSQDSDVGRVIVEGRVFAVNHKELKKRNAWVVNFDMTDYTGSIRVNRFMEADQAKPLIDAIQASGCACRASSASAGLKTTSCSSRWPCRPQRRQSAWIPRRKSAWSCTFTRQCP